MLRKIIELKENKKGISLIEILVTMAVAGIIVGMLGLFVSQGTVFFKKQSTIVDLTNESQIISGQLEQCMMEAKALVIKKVVDDVFIYTGQPDDDGNSWENPTGVERTVIVSEGKIYISSDLCNDISQVDESNLISEYIKEFDISISENSIEYETDEAGAKISKNYINPIVVNINYKLEEDNNTKSCNMTIKLRNYISYCKES